MSEVFLKQIRHENGFGVVYLNTEVHAYQWILEAAGTSCFGFDAEWKPCFHRGQIPRLGLIQIATDHSVMCLQLNALISADDGSAAAGCIGRLLSDPAMCFVGMGIEQDFNKVRSAVPGASDPRSRGPALVDLKKHGRRIGIEVSGGLSALTMMLDPLVAQWKSKKIQLSDWSRFPLSDAQIKYAAMDAWASLLSYVILERLRESGHGCGGRHSSTGGAGARGAENAEEGEYPAGAGGAASMPVPTDRRMTLDEFRYHLLSLYTPEIQGGKGVHAARIGDAIPRAAWPEGHRTLRSLAIAAGLEMHEPRAGALYIRLQT